MAEVKKQTVKSKDKDEIKISEKYRVPSELFGFIPQESAELYKIIPLLRKENMLYVGAVNPKSLDIRDILNFVTISQGLDYKLQKITNEQFKYMLEQYGQGSSAMTEALDQLEDQSVVLGVEDEEVKRSQEELIQEEAPIIKLVSTILAQAVDKEASDIHIEPGETSSSVRYRLDGVLRQQLKFARKIHDSLVARIKILSNLRLDERRRPQDGRFSSVIKNNRVDFRIATFPTSNGEKVVLRVLDKQKGLRTLADLGLRENMYDKVISAIKRPYGLILATGPTGAGKTTTLYALLNALERSSQNIVSLEDPVEYQLDGINQSNIRPEIGYTFATGLRSVLRGDPDQILVGEIRDKETAQLAVQAALTGHLVYSTLHTNTAIGAISRLINFGIDPFLLAPTLSLVIAQKMGRRIDGVGKKLPVSSGMKKHLDKKFEDLPQEYKSQIPDFREFTEAQPTDSNPSGMKGRIGVFETFVVDEEIRSLIFSNPSEEEIYKIARKKGFITIAEDAIAKGLNGDLPFSEVIKISNEDSLDLSEDVENTAPPVENIPDDVEKKEGI